MGRAGEGEAANQPQAREQVGEEETLRDREMERQREEGSGEACGGGWRPSQSKGRA